MMERNGYPRRFELTSDEIIKRKSASLPNYASLSIVNPFATFTHPSSDDRIAHHLNASTQKDARKRNPEKSKQFRWFRSRKVHNQVGHSDSESSSSLSSSASDATATHHGHSRGGGGGGGLLNCTSLCAKKDKHYGECPNDSKCGCERINAQEEPSPTIQVYREKTMSADNKGSCVSSRLSQSSRDLREVRPVKDLFSGFDLFTSCKRSPSLRDSLDNLNRRGKREALKARVEAQRRQYRDTSSDDEEQQWQQVKKYHSDEALHKISKEKRLREARTERFYKRKNRDDDTTRVDDDKTIAKNGNRKSTYADGQQSYSKHNFQRTLDTSTIAKANLKSGQFNELGNGILSGNNVGGGGGKPPNKNGRGRDLPTMTDTVLSCHLPIKKLGTVDGLTVGRAPTPPPRSFTKFHAMPSGDGTCWHSGRRPQSYAFETRLSPIRMNNGGTVQHATSENEARGCSNRMFQQLNGASRVKTPQPATAAPASTYAYVPNQPSPRPLSFTTTSQVIYNYLHFGKSEDAIKEPGPANTQVDMWRQQHHPLPPEPQINYMSDSQLSEKTPVQRRASVQYSDVSEAKTRPPSLYNFNSLAKPWSPGPAERVSSPVVQTAHSLMVSRPPPSPVRHSTEAFVFPPGGQGCRPGTVNSDLPSPKQQQQQLTSTNAIGASSSVNSMSTNRQGFGVNSTKENNNQQQQQLKSCNSNKMSATRPLSLVLESLESISRDRRYDERRRTRGCSPPPPPTRKHFRHTRSSNLEAIGQHLDNSVVKDHSNKGGGGGSKGGNDNLEDALLELEKIYQSMKNDDEAFYAEERLLRGRRNSTAGELNAATVKEQQQHHTFHQSRGLSKTPTMGSCDSLLDQLERACSTNSRKDDRSCDDLAYRKLARTTDSSRPASSYMGTTGSYLMLSPALSPSISIEDMMQSNNKTSQSNGTSKEPHTVLDDLAYRNIRDANLQKVVDPQPPFGIPLGPVVQASPNDYLHAQAQDLSRPKLIRRFRPDVVKDDLAYRNLRRDKKQNNNNNKAGPVRPQSAIVPSSELNFDELDSIVDVDLQYAINSRKKYRAARSLSANLSHLIGQNDGQRGAGLSLTVPKSYQGLDTEKSQSLNDLTDIFGAFPENLPKDRRHEGIGNSQSDVDQSPRQALLAVGAPKLVTRTFSDLNRSQKCNRSRQNALDSSSSTDTLTEMPNKMPETDDHKANNDIWQVRVTLGTVNTTSVRRNSQDLEKAAVNSDLVSPGSSGGGQTIQKTKATGCSTPEIVVPPRSNDSRESVMALRRNFFQFGYVSDSDAQLCRPKGSPIDEKQLDDLLNSLAQGAATAAGTAPRTASPLSSTRRPSAVVHQRSISCPQSPEDCYPRPNFLSVPTAVVTDSQIGEVSAKLVLPRLKFAGGGSASGQPLESVDRCPSMTAGEGDRPGNKESSATRCLKLSPSAYYGVTSTKTRDKEMMPAFGRTRNMVATTTTTSCSPDKSSLDRVMPGSISGYANFGTGAKMDSSSSVKEAVVAKDSCSKVTERPPTLRKLLLPASGGGNSTAVVTKEEGGHGVKLSAGMSSLGDRPEEKESLSDRMARYKEERRKQLASQYGQWSSSEDAPSVGEEPSYMRYSRRYKKKATTTGGDPAAEVEDGVKGNSEDARQRDGNGNNDDPSNCCKSVMMSTTVKGHSEEGDVCNNRHSVPGSPSKSLDKTHSPVEAVVRSNRASRLRAKMNGTCTSEGIGSITECSRQGSFRSKLPANVRLDPSGLSRLSSTTADAMIERSATLSQGATPISSSSEAQFSQGGPEQTLHITTESESGGTGSDAQGRPKDKSAKRKSNLNRMGALENTPVPSDTTSDTSRRPRKNRLVPGEASSASADGTQSDCLKSVGIVQSIQQQLSGAVQSGSVEPKASVQNGSSSLRRGDSRRAKDQDVDTSDSDFERGGSFRRPRRSALKRPEIPDIFRHKTAVTNLDSVIGGGDLKDIGASRESSRLVTPNNPPPAFRTLSSSAAVPQTPCSPSFSSTCGSLGSTNGVDRYASKFGQKEDGTAWWEVIKRPPNVPFSNLNVVSAPKGVSCGAGGRNLPRHTTNDLQTHTLKVNVGGTGGGLNGKSDGNVSDTLRELTELVRETTSRVDCLTDAARRVELRSPNLSEMGGRLGKSSSTSTAPSTLEDGTLNSQVTVSTKPSVEDAKDEPESGQAVKRIASQYTSDGNWQLGRSPPANGALQRPADDQVVKIGIGQNVNVAFGGDVVGGGLKTSSASDRLSLSSDVAADDRQRAESPNLPSELKRFGSFSNLSSQGIMVPEPSISGIVSRAEMDLEQELLSIINTLDGGSSQHSDKVAVEPRRRSACLDDKGEVPSDIQSGPALGMEAMESHTAAPSILKKKSVVDEGETYTKSILKHKDEKSTEGKPPVPPSILKRGSFDDISRHHSPEKTSSILKKRGSSEDSDHRSSSPEVVSILRRRSAEEAEGDYAFGERHSILRRKSAAEESEHSRSILKKQSTVDSTDGVHAEPRPILKKKTSVEETELLDPKPILKKRSSTEEELEERPKPILKVRKRSGQEDIAEDHIRGTSLATSLRMRYLEDESLRLSSTSPRQPSLSSEDDEFHSLPLSPVNWKTRKESDLEEVDDDHRSASRSAWSPIVVPTGNRDVATTAGSRSGEKLSPHEVQDVECSRSSDPALESISQALPRSKEEEEEDDKEEEDGGGRSSSNTTSSSSEDEESATSSSASSHSPEQHKRLDVSSFGKSLNKPSSPTAVAVNAAAATISKSRDFVEDDGSARLSSVAHSSSRETSRLESVAFIRGEVLNKDTSVHKDEPSRKREQPVEAINTSVATAFERNKSSDDHDKKSDSNAEEDVIHLSVAAKASLFMQKLQEQRSPRPAAVRKFVNRRNLPRSQTQPVTVEEVQEASKIAEDSVRRQKSIDDLEQKTVCAKSATGVDSEGMTPQTKDTPESEESDPSKLSLAERVKLFNQKMIEVRLPTRKLSNGEPTLSEPPRRRRVVSTRFRTQPVTTEEVEKAQLISPLAVSLVKPCEDTTVTDVAPTRQQRSIFLKSEEEAVSVKSTTASSTTASSSLMVARSGGDSSSKPKGILKKREDVLQLSKLEGSKSVSSSFTKSSVSSEVSTSRQQTSATVTKYSGGYSKSEVTSTTLSSLHGELKSILKDTASVHPPSPLKLKESVADKEQIPSSSSSSSSDDDEEEETEGITISLRDSGSHSSPSTASDTPRIKNEAVLRRRNATLRKLEEKKFATELQHSQSLTLESSLFVTKSGAIATPLTAAHLSNAAALTRNVKATTTTTASTQRSSTQPLTRMEQIAANGTTAATAEVKGSIAQRLAALQASQQEDWRRRLAKMKAGELEDDARVSYSESETMSVTSGDESPSRIVEKVSLLEFSQQGWRSRVEEKDVSKFTVAGKMGKVSPPMESPLLDRKKRTPKPVRFQSRTANLIELTKSSPSTPATPPNLPIARSKSMPMSQAHKEEEKMVKVAVPKPDEEGMSSFFQSVSLDKLQSQKVEVAEAAFNAIASESRQLLVQKRTVHVVRHHTGAKNPLKSLAARQDMLQEEYTEVKTGVAEKELRRMKVEQLAKHSDLATSALAGLASTEDFKNVSLRKSSSVMNFQLLPYKDLMLIQVKGRRHVQCRLVEPKLLSLNKGDCFILVTPNEVYHWIGEFSNVIERVKGAEVATIIQGKKDLGCKNADDVVTIDEEKKTTSRSKQRDFYQHLGGQDDVADAGSPEEDEIFEASITDTNKVYNVEGNELVPYEKFWGSLLRVEMLEPTKVLVFDFGSEMYVWQGKLATNEQRKKAIQLAQELWSEGYDYTECDANPLNPCRNQVVLSFGKQRPSWALFAKVNQHMETVLFRAKFVDWPDMERIIKVKRQDSEVKSDGSLDLQPCDVYQMLSTTPTEPDMVLENCHLGRGLFFWDEEERRHCDISTLGIKVWHILEFNHSILPIESWGQFYSGETYVVRWQYRVTVVGRQLSGKLSKHSSLGRERCAYFFWQGSHSTINEKGASALMTVELDEERGPHVRVVQGYEPPCFLNLFKGSMVVHRGKMEEGSCPAEWRMFVARAEFDQEVHLVEVACSTHSLRSGGAFVVVRRKKCLVYLWFGARCPQHVKDISRHAVEVIQDRKPPEFGFEIGDAVKVEEFVQGSESDDFFKGLGGRPEEECIGALRNYVPAVSTPRLFYMTSVSGVFIATEVTCSFGSNERLCAFPFLQTELYNKVQQPALFLLDHGTELYLWQGWWPESSDDNDNMSTGSAHLRWNVERRLAMETVIQYCNAKNEESPPVAYAVWAGLEPIELKHLFPEWEERDDVTELNLKDGRQIGEKKLVKDTLVVLKRTRYPFAELQERPLPEGVDPSILESYLTSEEFMEVLKMSKKDFYALPSWKQVSLKKAAGLY